MAQAGKERTRYNVYTLKPEISNLITAYCYE